MPRHPN